MFTVVDTHIEAGTLIKEFRMSALPSLYGQFVQLIKYLMENAQKDKDQVVILFQDMLEVVTRYIMIDLSPVNRMTTTVATTFRNLSRISSFKTKCKSQPRIFLNVNASHTSTINLLNLKTSGVVMWL